MKKATTTLFAQLVGMMPRSILEGIAAQFYKPGNASKFTVWDQLVALVFCHIGGCDSLREIEDGLYSALRSLNHAGGAPASTLFASRQFITSTPNTLRWHVNSPA